jgi:predicted RND superfamily exporter protein
MGIICGGGLMVCLVPMMTLLPVLLMRGKQNVIDHEHPPVDRRGRLERLWLDRPWTVAGVTLALSGVAVLGGLKVRFDYNLLHMQSAGLAAVVFEEKLIKSSEKSVLFGAVVAESLADARRLEGRLTNLPGVASIDSMARFIGDDQAAKLRIVTQVKSETGRIQFAPVDRAPLNAEELSRSLWSLRGYLGLALDDVGDSDKSLATELESLRRAIAEFRKGLLDEANPERIRRATGFQSALFDDLHATFRSLREQDDSASLGVDDLPRSLRSRFVGVTGKHLLMVYPKQNVWDREPQAEFVAQLRSVDENATGTPVQLYEYTSLLRTSYEKAAWYALAAIALMVLFHFKSPVCVILSLIPVGLGFFWMVGFMGWRGIDFNPANIMTLPLVVGIGVTNGIHILNRFAEERDPGILGKSTGKAVLVSGLTTIAGFGSLVVADHRGISSLGFTMAVGVTTCMVVGLTFLPALLKLLGRAGWKMKNPAPD